MVLGKSTNRPKRVMIPIQALVIDLSAGRLATTRDGAGSLVWGDMRVVPGSQLLRWSLIVTDV